MNRSDELLDLLHEREKLMRRVGTIDMDIETLSRDAEVVVDAFAARRRDSVTREEEA